jgi:hypothetical protein
MGSVKFTAVASAPNLQDAVALIQQLRMSKRAGEDCPYLNVQSSRRVMTDESATHGHFWRRDRQRDDGAASSRLPALPEARAHSFRCVYEHRELARPFPE